MELNVNSPGYFSDFYGIIDEIYWMCRELSAYVRNNCYSSCVERIEIQPIIEPKDYMPNKKKEGALFCSYSSIVDVSKEIDFDAYYNGNIEEKKALMIKNILQSIKAVSRKGKIDYKKFEDDVLKFCEEKNIKL